MKINSIQNQKVIIASFIIFVKVFPNILQNIGNKIEIEIFLYVVGEIFNFLILPMNLRINFKNLSYMYWLKFYRKKVRFIVYKTIMLEVIFQHNF